MMSSVGSREGRRPGVGSVIAVLVAGLILLAGCTSPVPGAPVADPSAVPRPDTGSYPTTPRTLQPIPRAAVFEAEALRMLAVLPLIYEADAAFQFGAGGSFGEFEPRMASAFGSVGAARLAAAEIGVRSAATTTYVGAAGSTRRVDIGLFRLPSPEMAAAVVSGDLLAKDAEYLDIAPPDKVALPVPGFPAAVGYTMAWPTRGIETVAYVPLGRFVLTFAGAFGSDQIAKYAAAADKALSAFKPTPLEDIGRLPIDESGLARMTLEPTAGSPGYSVPARAVLPMQYHVSATARAFEEAGVDVAARGASSVYRARDRAGAASLLDARIAEVRENRQGAAIESVRGVPTGQCFTYTSGTTTTYCVAAVGRYVVELTDGQRQRAVQGLGASYLLLRSAA